MLEVTNNPIIRDYLLRLRKELVIRGLSQERTQEVIHETEAHFTDMAAAVEANSDAHYRAMVQEFGPVEALAKNVAKEYERSDTTRRFLWPALFAILMLGFLRLGILDSLRTWIPQSIAWEGFLAVCIFGFICLGFMARKPSMGQFATLAAVLVVGGTAFAAITTFPVGIYGGGLNSRNEPSWFEGASRSDPESFVNQMKLDIAATGLVTRRMELAKKIFVAKNEGQNVPRVFAYRGRYWKPEGLRELTLGIPPEHLGPSLSAASWAEAVQSWNGLEPSMAVNEADWNIKMLPSYITADERTIAYCYWIQKQPLMTQIKLDFQEEWPPSAFACVCGLLLTNCGWLLWLLARPVQRYVRRLRYSSGAVAA